jgi:undecaprenyl-diphosphatase
MTSPPHLASQPAVNVLDAHPLPAAFGVLGMGVVMFAENWSFPSNHAAIAAAAAMALLFVSRRLAVVAIVAAPAMGASRVWVGAHYPHDVLAGLAAGALVAAAVMLAARRQAETLARRLTAKRLGALLLAS